MSKEYREFIERRKREEPAPEEPTTKKCPECLSEIPIEARRYAHCTTQLKRRPGNGV